jgi:hypothetical protein
MNIKYLKTLCVVIHYGSVDYTNKCINSLVNEKNLDIVIVDNDPHQSYKAPKYIKQLLKIIKTGGAEGFSKSNNIGVNSCLTKDYGSILILNNDTIVTQGSLDYLLDTLNFSDVGAVGPCMPYANQRKKIWACGGVIKKFRVSIGGIQPKDQLPYQVDYLPAAAILCRADLWKQIGGLNEEYFLAYEEAEFALELKKRGFKVMADPRSIILHHVGMSSQHSPKYYYNGIRNRLIFSKYLYGKNIGLTYGIVITSLSFFNACSLKELLQRIRLWTKAISDDFKGVPISQQILKSIT